MRLDYTPAQMYKQYAACVDKKEQGRCLRVLSELTCLAQKDLLALIQKEQKRVEAEERQKAEIIEVISELACDLASIQEILGYLRYLGLNDEKSTYYYWRVRDDMRVGNFVVGNEERQIIVEAILNNVRPVACYNANKFPCSKKEFQSIWYRIKNELKSEGKAPAPNMEELNDKLLEDIRERVGNGQDKDECYSHLKSYITRKRFDILWDKATEKSNPEPELDVDTDEPDIPDDTPVSMSYVISKLKDIYNTLGELIKELEVEDD